MILAIILAVALFIAAMAARKNPSLKPLVVILGVAVLVLAALHIFSPFHSRSTYTPGPESALGYFLGEEIAQQHTRGGAVLVILEQPHGPKMERQAEAQLEGLASAFAGSGLEAATVYYQPVEDDLVEPGSGFPVSACRSWLAEHPDAVAVASFTGFPAQARPSECKGWPPFYVFAPGPWEGLGSMVRRGVIKALVVFRSDTNPTEPIPEGASRKELFDRRYRFATEN